MYSDFFGLRLTPFNNTPDPRFFFNTLDHDEAVASLIYAAQERKGFALLTGEVGSGKTLLGRLVLSRLERSAKIAVVHNTRVGPRELLFSICREFDVRVGPDAAAPEMSSVLHEFLLDEYARDRLAVVIVDEAQHLTPESFEELRLLGNLEADDAKLLTVLIFGQPELQETFWLPQMRQLQQRLYGSFHLTALNRELTEGYIAHRLRVAGLSKGQTIFDRSALDAVFAASGGIPRLINQICDGAMLAAYAQGARKITGAMVSEFVEQSGTTSSPSRTGVFRKALPGEPLTSQRIIVETRAADEAIRLLEERVREAADSSVRARRSVEESLTIAKSEFAQATDEFATSSSAQRAQLGASLTDVHAAKRDLAALVLEQRRQLEALRTAVEGATRRAVEQTGAFKNEVSEFQNTVAVQFQTGRKELEGRIAEAARLEAEIDRRSRAAATTLGGLRSTLAQINERAEVVRKDLVELGDQVKCGSARSVEGLKQGVAELLQQIDDKRTDFRGDVAEACERVSQVEKRFAHGVMAAKSDVKQIVDDARVRFEATQSQARDVLTQAQASATTSQEQAAQMLAEARAFAERLRDQVEATVRRSDATALSTLREVEDLRTDLRKDREQVREQILESKTLVGEARQETARMTEQARVEATRLIELANSTTSRLFEEAGRFERESQARADRIIQHARETEGRVESLLRLPKEIIDEANARAASLAELSKSLSPVITQLGAAGETARARKQEITEASALAEERLEGLRSHTVRVGQLVGIIRQLYGAMDARIVGMRGRLNQADELCRTVPREIDSLRSALSGRSAAGKTETTTGLSAVETTRRPKSPVVKSSVAASASPPAPGMLGDIVSRNRKLHEWLRQTINEGQAEGADSNKPAVRRAHVESSESETVVSTK